MSEPKWFSSGRGIFKREAGFQLATVSVSVKWQEDTAMIVDLLNKGEVYDALRKSVVEAASRLRNYRLGARSIISDTTEDSDLVSLLREEVSAVFARERYNDDYVAEIISQRDAARAALKAAGK